MTASNMDTLRPAVEPGPWELEVGRFLTVVVLERVLGVEAERGTEVDKGVS